MGPAPACHSWSSLGESRVHAQMAAAHEAQLMGALPGRASQPLLWLRLLPSHLLPPLGGPGAGPAPHPAAPAGGVGMGAGRSKVRA